MGLNGELIARALAVRDATEALEGAKNYLKRPIAKDRGPLARLCGYRAPHMPCILRGKAK